MTNIMVVITIIGLLVFNWLAFGFLYMAFPVFLNLKPNSVEGTDYQD